MAEFKTVANTADVAPGAMKRIELEGQEVLLANVDGAFHAVSDRCGHMSASLAAGALHGTEVACKFHGAKFSVVTGEVIAAPTEQAMEQLTGYFQQLGLPEIETCALVRHEVRVQGQDVQVKLS